MRTDELLEKLNEAPIGFAVFEGPAMVMRSANPRYLEMVSRNGEAVGKTWLDVFPELEGSPTHDAVRAASSGIPFAVQEYPVPLVRDGELRDSFYSFNLEPTHAADGSVDGFLVVAVEVTEVVRRRREAEELAARLEEREARYRAVFESIDDGFALLEMIVDGAGVHVDYRFLEVNDAFTRHTGLVDPVGKTAKQLVPDLDESWFQFYGKIADTGEPARFENNAPAMNRWFDVFANRVGDPRLRQVGLVFKDVSGRKRAEEEKEALFLAEQTARVESDRANRLKDEFLATVSHELRTPLNSMIGWLSLLRAGHVPTERVPYALETVERNARAQAQLIEDLLDVSRILEGKLRLEVEAVHVPDVIEAAIETVRPAADAKGIRLQSTLSSAGTVMGDSHRLQQIVWNLLSNAVKFTPRGGRVQVLVVKVDSSVEITVTDTGTGIAAEFQPHVFDRFRQADGGTTRSHGGLGLGLSIVRHLTELHGGVVTVFSKGVGEGASFTVRLPVALVRRSDVGPTSELGSALVARGFECPPELDGMEIVAVDDEEDSRAVLQSVLESCGAKVRVASSVAGALALVAERVPAVVVSDIGMPGADGFDLIAALRALPVEDGGDVAAIALTAYARTEDRTRCLLAGFNNHVPKPVEPLELVAAVAALGRRRSIAP